ncbi:hypothetical protein EDC04DRAFT_2727725 [Pisolithus marmoratus]|nr:hypothetical protein EDC04DRAFT_2727725 [Pisolithus marmoratus]
MPATVNKPMKPKVKRYYGYSVFLFIMGTLFPPLAVAARFGIGKDFWINLLLTIAGYIPGHVHNFYIQNVRNNKNRRRTPKWVQRFGLVDTSTFERRKKRSEWAHRYNDRNPESTLDGQPLEEGQVGPSRSSTENSREPSANAKGLWRPEDESFYSEGRDGSSESSGGRWRYPANFDDAFSAPGEAVLKKKKKKDRWARTEDAYAAPAPRKKKKKKTSKNRSTVGDGDTYSQRNGSAELETPEDPNGASYGRRDGNGQVVTDGGQAAGATDDIFNHEL